MTVENNRKYVYNNQNKAKEILANPYEGQRTQTNMIFRIPYCVAAQKISFEVLFMPLKYCKLCSQKLLKNPKNKFSRSVRSTVKAC